MKFFKDKVAQVLAVAVVGLGVLSGTSENVQHHAQQEYRYADAESNDLAARQQVNIINFFRMRWANDIQDKCGGKTSLDYVAATYPGFDYRKVIDESTIVSNYNQSNLSL